MNIKNGKIVIEKPSDMPDELFRLIQLGAKESSLKHQLKEVQKEMAALEQQLLKHQ